MAPTSSIAETDSARVDRLFLLASEGGVRYRDLVQPAKDSLGEMGEAGARWLVRKLGATDARERHTLADIFEKLGKSATPYVIPYLDSVGEYYPRNAARALGRIGDASAVPALLKQLDNEYYSVRSRVATSLGEIKDPRAVSPLLVQLKTDVDGDVRKSCVVALGRIGDARALTALVFALEDPFFGVRQAATVAIPQLESVGAGALAGGVDVVRGIALYGYIVALGGVDDNKARDKLRSLLDNNDPMIRGFAVEGLTQHPDKKSSKSIAKLKVDETDSFVLAQIAHYEAVEAKP